jgi:hypothetical protein
MNPAQQERWRFEAINQILLAMARSRDLRDNLVFKGALVLNRRLGTSRMSLDIDANLDVDYAKLHPDREGQRTFLEQQIGKAISRHFESQDPVRYELKRLSIALSPKEQHPREWNAFAITVSLIDHKHVGGRGLPNVTIDVAAPETLSERSIADLDVDGVTIRAYSLERIAGEKARAFLSTLPAYRAKMKKPGEAVRVKDLYDLTRIIRAKPISDTGFWTIAGQEFLLACESRYVDCSGLDSFMEDWAVTRATFNASRVIPKDDCTFEEAEATIVAITEFWRGIGLFPRSFPLP